MSSNQSNPIFVDPSIVTLEKDASASLSSNQNRQSQSNERKLSHSSIHNLEPGNALSRLLDSAMAHAAKESTPELTATDAEHVAQDITESTDLETLLNTIPPSKQGKENIYTISKLLELKSDLDDAPHIKDLLPELSFWRLKAQREPHPRHLNNNLNSENGGAYKGKKFKKHQNETWERGKHHSNNYGENSKPDQFTRRGSRHGFFKAEELDSLSSEKISQLLGEGPEELEPEWDSEIIGDGKIGKSGDDDLSHMSMMNMGQTVEDFEKWKYQMKLQEKRRRGEVVDEDIEQQQMADDESAAKNAGNEVDNFFSFIKPTHKEPTIEEEVVVSATVEEPAQANVASNNANHRSSRFSSFFQQPSNQPAKETNKSVSEETQKQSTSATIPPPGFSKFFGGQKSGPQTPQYTSEPPSLNASETRLPQLQRQGSSWSSPSGQPASHQPEQAIPMPQQPPQQPPMQHQSSNDSFFRSLLKKKENTQPSPSSASSTPLSEHPPTTISDGKRSSVSGVSVSDTSVTPGQLSRKASTGNDGEARFRGIPLQQQQHQQQQQQQHVHPGQIPPGLFPPGQFPPGQFPPWMRGPPQQMGNFPPGFQPPMPRSQFQQQQPHQQDEQGGNNKEGNATQSPSQQSKQQLQQQYPQQQHPQQQPRFPHPGQQQPGGRVQMPPPGMFPNGFMPPMPPPPGTNFPQGQGPPPGFRQPQIPPEFLNNPNARFIPPQYLGMQGGSPQMPPPPGLQQQQHTSRGAQQGPNPNQQQPQPRKVEKQ
ncbi:hypothetical protein CORT_0H00920 [Candida orthopsilosis Co 90-125]|uniref:Uncharacterized protein n=1 Tax=Candida orthopsilosis (strain 90-125) TaxID=1136231 RepID=H8XAW0_CANO9|nr:hypothetical protein CORT_0H00920 [Candida orthopsilosis Co 90-125]CCG25208.1 hypothetical protein CORT_0H00920 [Candida orthopsilosis Co 90-125]